MLGCIAIAKTSTDARRIPDTSLLPPIATNEHELEHATWLPIADAPGALARGEKASKKIIAMGRAHDVLSSKAAASNDSTAAESPKASSSSTKRTEGSKPRSPVSFIPGPYAIAHHLVKRAIDIASEGKIADSSGPEASKPAIGKGKL